MRGIKVELMSIQPESRQPRSGLAPWWIGVACALIVIACGVASVWHYFAQISGLANRFIARHAEAGPIIEAIYQYRFDKGKWPADLQSLPPKVQDTITVEWQYSRLSEDPAEPPMLMLRGPLHMKLIYQFRKDGALNSPGGWEASSEGSSWPGNFTERVPARPAERQ